MIPVLHRYCHGQLETLALERRQCLHQLIHRVRQAYSQVQQIATREISQQQDLQEIYAALENCWDKISNRDLYALFTTLSNNRMAGYFPGHIEEILTGFIIEQPARTNAILIAQLIYRILNRYEERNWVAVDDFFSWLDERDGQIEMVEFLQRADQALLIWRMPKPQLGEMEALLVRYAELISQIESWMPLYQTVRRRLVQNSN